MSRYGTLAHPTTSIAVLESLMAHDSCLGLKGLTVTQSPVGLSVTDLGVQRISERVMDVMVQGIIDTDCSCFYA